METILQAPEDSLSLFQIDPAIIDAVDAVLSVQKQLALEGAIQRIPDGLRGNSFFGEFDLWLYQTIEPDDNRICFNCRVLDKITWTGLELRLAFPYLEIIDTNTILVYVHPNCRCTLTRITDPLAYLQLDLGPGMDWLDFW